MVGIGIGMDWISPGGVRYRAPYGANNYRYQALQACFYHSLSTYRQILLRGGNQDDVGPSLCKTPVGVFPERGVYIIGNDIFGQIF